MTDRKKPGVAFWATVVASMPVLYVLGFGPACWLVDRGWLTGRPRELAGDFYTPIVWAYVYGPSSVSHTIEWYATLWSGLQDEEVPPPRPRGSK